MTDRPIGLSVDDLARGLAGAAVLNGRRPAAVSWDDLDDAGREPYRRAARDALAQQAEPTATPAP